jgi:alkanesulfonate monooxygenase SsuD/methylene tetrahydromethanopterin reductase-like flavin-dependent oxidoreductase (luciferase family)
MGMDFGIFYEIEIPKPWHERSEYDAFKQVLAQVVQAEEAGFTNFWTVEHHFLSEFSHCSAPEVLYGAISQRTKKIKIGHGVRLLPFPYNHPIRVAEMAATLDLLCDGRLQFGTGRSITLDELVGFGIEPSQTRELWEEALEIVVGAWTNETFAWEGKHFQIPPRTVIPKPLQKPHPPLWAAGTGPETHELIGRKGLGLLSFTILVEPEELARRIELYRQGLKDCQPVGKFINNQAATFTMAFCAETNAEARKVAEESIMWYLRQIVDGFKKFLNGECWYHPNPGKRELGPTFAYTQQAAEADMSNITFDYLLEHDLIIVGDPETCIQKLKKYQQAGTDQLLAMMQIYKIPHQKIMDSINLWGKYVIPYFK